jgi:hypothetical protein
MKISLLFLLVAGLSITGLSQKPARSPAKPVDNFVLKKQIFVDDIESQLSSVPVAGVRIGIRTRLAEWLWKSGKDDTGRAEPLAVKAVEELFEKEDEITDPEWLRGPLFQLLEKNAKETAARLKAKYFKNPEDDLTNAFEWLGKEGGDKVVADKVLKYLGGKGRFDGNITFILRELRDRRSPQYVIVLGAILRSAEEGRISLDVSSLSFLASDFRDPAAPAALVRRYFELVMARARAGVQAPGPEDQTLTYLLAEIIRDLGEKIPDLVPEAEGLKAALLARTTRAEDRKREAEDRIQASADKLGALIDEAEKAETLNEKNSFYVRAEILADETGKFAIAIRVLSILRNLNKEDKFYSNSWTDQEFARINEEGLKKDDVENAQTARELIVDEIRRGEAWRVAAVYFKEKNDQIDADDALNRSIKLLANADRENTQRVHALIRLIPGVRKVDKMRLREVIVLTARAIDDLPTPGPDDKPGTDNFKKYVRTVMAINVNITAAMNPLLKDDKAEAAEFASRIQKRENRIFAEMLVGIDKLETAQTSAEKKAALIK